MRLSSVLVAAAITIVIAAAARAARADERATMTLEYSIAEGAIGCPTKAEVEARLAAEVGYDPVVASNPTLATTFEVSAVPTGFRGRYSSQPVSGSASLRELSDTSCDDLVSSFVLSAAISLDPEVAPTPKPSAPEKVVSIPVPVPVYVDRPVGTPPAAAPVSRLQVTFQAGYGVGGGLVPGPAHGPIAYVGVRGEMWEAGIEGSYVFEGIASSSAGDVLVSAAFASIVPCFAPTFANRFRFFGCGHVALGGGFIDATHVTTPSPSTLPLVLLGLRLGLGIRIAGPLEARIFGDGLANVAPIDASIMDHGTERIVFSSPPVAGRGVVALAIAVP
jgi:hypothetical protein